MKILNLNFVQLHTEKDAPGDQIEYVDKSGKMYCSVFIFKEIASIGKRMADLFKRRVKYEENECKRYELLMDKCFEIQKLV